MVEMLLYRGKVRVSKEALNADAMIKCDTLILDELSKK